MQQITRKTDNNIQKRLFAVSGMLNKRKIGLLQIFFIKFYFTAVEIQNFLFLKTKLRSAMTLLFYNYFLIKYKILLTTEKISCVFIG